MNEKRSLKIFLISLFLMLPAFVYGDNKILFDTAGQAIASEEQSSLKTLLGRSMIKDGKQFLIIENYFPEYYGVIQSSGFYSPSEDSAEWIEDLLIQLEEERIAEEIRQMEKELEEYNSEAEEEDPGIPEESLEVAEENQNPEEPLPEQKPSTPAADAIENFFNQNTEGITFTDKNSQLEFYQFDNEILMRQNSNGKYSVINSTGNKITRNFYDERMRLTSREKWNVSNIQKAFIEKKEVYNYDGDTTRITSKEKTENDKLEIIKYNDKGAIETINSFVFVEEKKYLTFKRLCSYNDEGKIVSDETVEYFYKPDYKKLSEEVSKKYVYEYNSDGIPPDFQYSENGILKMRNKYSEEKGTYTTQVFFEDGFSVKTYYEKDARIKEVYYNGNNVMREKVYETSNVTVQ